MEQEQQKRYRAWAEIDLNALTHNVQTVQKLLPAQTQYMAVVKANAYGHGDEAICRKLWELGVRWFAVSNLEEALSVRQFCPYGEIFILGYTPPEFAPELARNNIIQGVLSMEYARQLQHFAHQPVRCHIKLDTGMGRIGFRGDSPAECAKALLPLFDLEKLSIEGIYTHFAVADSPEADDVAYTQAQEDSIVAVYDELAKLGHPLKHLHFMNSAATVTRPNPRATLARVGIIMYGLEPNYPIHVPMELHPVMSLRAWSPTSRPWRLVRASATAEHIPLREHAPSPQSPSAMQTAMPGCCPIRQRHCSTADAAPLWDVSAWISSCWM